MTPMQPFRDKRGSEHRKSKLTPDQVREIRRLAGMGVSDEDLAAKFKMDRAQIRRIVKFKAYFDVD